MSNEFTLKRLISFEGIECSGKSSAIKHIQDLNLPILTTREPGGTELGWKLRELLFQNANTMNSFTETLLFYADRTHHVETMLRPWLEKLPVITDRYFYTTLAYQGAHGNEFPQVLNNVLMSFDALLKPSRVILFDIDVETYIQRKRERGVVKGEEVNHFEERDRKYFQRVIDIFHRHAEANPDLFIVIDATQPKDVVMRQVEDIVRREFGYEGIQPQYRNYGEMIDAHR